jgi:hypothetical protein
LLKLPYAVTIQPKEIALLSFGLHLPEPPGAETHLDLVRHLEEGDAPTIESGTAITSDEMSKLVLTQLIGEKPSGISICVRNESYSPVTLKPETVVARVVTL